MFTDYLTPRRVIVAALLIVLAAVSVIPWLPAYAPVRQSVTLRYLESRGRSPAQLQERAAERRRIDEEERRKAEQNRAQSASWQSYPALLTEFRNIARPRNDAIDVLLKNIAQATTSLRERAARPAFYTESELRPEETSTHRACGDPAGTADLINRAKRRERNIYACTVYLVGDSTTAPRERNVTVGLLQRISFPQYRGYYPFQTIVAYVWIDQMASALRRGEEPPALPPMMDGDDFNPAIFGGVLAPGFARQLIDTAENEEKLTFSRMTYPELTRLREVSSRLLVACKETGRTNCIAN